MPKGSAATALVSERPAAKTTQSGWLLVSAPWLLVSAPWKRSERQRKTKLLRSHRHRLQKRPGTAPQDAAQRLPVENGGTEEMVNPV